jgi:hypothetical protein
MSQQTVQPAAPGVVEPPAPLLPDSDEQSGGADNRRKLILAGAGLGVLLLVVVAFFLLKSGGSSSSDSFVPPHHTPRAAAGAQPASAPITLPRQVTPQSSLRNPFKPLYVAPAPASNVPAAGGTAGSTAGGTGTTTVSTGSNGVSTGGSSTGTSAPTAPPPGYSPVSIQLDKVVGVRSASFTVFYSNGKRALSIDYANVPAPKGSTRTAFASVFSLLSIQDGQATVQYGDSTPFDLARGGKNKHALD